MALPLSIVWSQSIHRYLFLCMSNLFLVQTTWAWNSWFKIFWVYIWDQKTKLSKRYIFDWKRTTMQPFQQCLFCHLLFSITCRPFSWISKALCAWRQKLQVRTHRGAAALPVFFRSPFFLSTELYELNEFGCCAVPPNVQKQWIRMQGVNFFLQKQIFFCRVLNSFPNHFFKSPSVLLMLFHRRNTQ